MNISNYLLPKNQNNPVSFCTHKAKEYAAHSNPLISIVAARAFAAFTPIAAFACGINFTVKGLTHFVISKINPKLAAEHMNSWEEIKSGLKCFVLVAFAVTYAASAILLGSRILDKIPSPKFEFTYARNRKSCIEMSKNNHSHHIINHQGLLISRPSIPFINRQLEDETVELLLETFQLANVMNDVNTLDAIKKIVKNTTSTSEHYGWTILKAAAQNKTPARPLEALKNTINAILNNTKPETYVFSKTEILESLKKYYSNDTIEKVFDFYTPLADSYITTRLLHAIIIGIQANLREDDVKPPTSERLKEMRKPLSAPQVYYSDPHYIQVRKDMYFLSFLEYANCYKPLEKDQSRMKDYREYGLAEFLARFLVYPLFGTAEDNWSFDFTDVRTPKYSEGTLFSCYHKNEEVLMSIEKLVSAPGLRMIEVYELQKRFGATVFRGTSDLSGLKRDFELAGVGRTSFEENKDKMVEVFKTKKPAEWHIVGHSLGAADAQRFMHAVVSSIKKDELPKLHLWTFNSPRIEHDIADDFLTHARTNRNITIRHSRTLGDFIHFPGKIMLGENASPNELDCSTVDVAVPWFIRTWRERHTTALYSAYLHPNGRENSSIPLPASSK